MLIYKFEFFQLIKMRLPKLKILQNDKDQRIVINLK